MMKNVNCKEKKNMRYLVARDVGTLSSVVEKNVVHDFPAFFLNHVDDNAGVLGLRAIVIPNGRHAVVNYLRGFKRKSANEHW